MTATNQKIPSSYEIRTIAEHAMRRLFQASGRSWEEFGPEDAQRAEWIEQALTVAAEAADDLNAERTDWNVPRKTALRPVAINGDRALAPRVLSDRLNDDPPSAA